MEKGADINLANSDSKTPLLLAKEKDNQTIAKLLLNKALLNAVKDGSINDVKECLKDSAIDINHLERYGWTPLHHATNKTVDDQELVKLLVGEGANVNATTNYGDKPLHIASSNAHKEIVKFFIDEKGLDVNDRGKDNWTPLHHAVNKGSMSLVEFLIRKEANIYAENSNSTTPLELAKNGNNKEIKGMLLGKALIDAVKQNDIRKVGDRIHEGADVDYSYEDNKWTPLHHAASLYQISQISRQITHRTNGLNRTFRNITNEFTYSIL